MEERELKNNYIFTLVKLFLFLIIFCFLAEFIRYFVREIHSVAGLDFNILVGSVISTFAFYLLLIDLNGFYKKIQKFFFRSAFFSYLFPSILIFLALSYFFVPKLFNISFNKDLFVFLGGFSLFVHLIYVSRATRGKSFNALINYFFIFSILMVIHLILFGFYLKISFNFGLGEILLNGIQEGTTLIKDIFIKGFK
ncbi:MAG: hypothetical protein K9L87_03020 [Candidatus Omnitrophica bacterium]|nr:hypothetical protein [Candidatus Omnitrophota bacterium]MCF7892038.1 hypothetical protein [Candidatus Omnitrophota bacterium]MCF7896183.1 hypothetical protein [Candidatus Omnitrophota bacterium]MCF7897704.1 hypothetical protein [Candidatus Omnitrophota bacterium]MCF7909541.1 hypothetical protein [Candidatus Omnitrophota bacterium]